MAPANVLQRVALSRAMDAIGPGAAVSTSPYCATPSTLLRALAGRAEEVPGLVLLAGLLLDGGPYLDLVRSGRLRYRTWHVSAAARSLAGSPGVEYVPLRAGAVPAYLEGRVDAALVRVTPPDARGMCSLGPSASYSRDLLAAARLRIAEVDPDLPRTFGADVTYPYDGFDHVVDADTPMCTYPSAATSADAEAIAGHVVGLIGDGAAVQLGIGTVPEAVGRALSRSGARGLRLIGMLSDDALSMVEAGCVSGAPGAIQVAELLGSQRLFRFADGNTGIEMLSSRKVHDPAWLAAQPGLVSVCSALEVDLTGQVASEETGGRLIAGVGGSADFFEGAALSSGGARVIALPSVTAGGRSRLRAALAASTPVTIPRHSVDYVVTEYGTAHLTGLSLAERAERLVAIAAPQHRNALAEAWTNRTHQEDK